MVNTELPVNEMRHYVSWQSNQQTSQLGSMATSLDFSVMIVVLANSDYNKSVCCPDLPESTDNRSTQD